MEMQYSDPQWLRYETYPTSALGRTSDVRCAGSQLPELVDSDESPQQLLGADAVLYGSGF